MILGRKPTIEMIGVYFWGDKVYVPVMGKAKSSGTFWELDGLMTGDATREILISLIEQAMTTGNPPIKHPSPSAQNQWTPMQSEMKAKTGKTAARRGVRRCLVQWFKDEILIYYSATGCPDLDFLDYDNPIRLPLTADAANITDAIFDRWYVNQ